MKVMDKVRTVKTKIWCVITILSVVTVMQVAALNGPNVCMVKQKYNITKRVKYRAPMSVRTYEWCFNMPPRCSRWSTEMRDLTRLETEERTAEVAVCCPGYKMRDVSCVPICPNGKTGTGCSEDCPPNKWGPNCVHECKKCTEHGSCSPITGECRCQEGWQGESCEINISTTTTSTTPLEELLTSTKSTTKTTILPETTPVTTTSRSTVLENSPDTGTKATSIIMRTTEEATVKPESTTTLMERTDKTTTTVSTESQKMTTMYYNLTLTTPWSRQDYESKTYETTLKYLVTNSIYNRTEIPSVVIKTTESIISTTGATTVPISTIKPKTTALTVSNIETKQPITWTTVMDTTTKDTKLETTKKAETPGRIYPTTVKFKPKEIWIKPAQKGESPLVESKVKLNYDIPHIRSRSATKKEILSVNTTPKTIIVSIIPTSVSYSTFKKIALTTTPYLYQKINNVPSRSYNRSTDQGSTKSMSVPTSSTAPFTIKVLNYSSPIIASSSTTFNPVFLQNTSKTRSYTSTTKGLTSTSKTVATNSTVYTTNSMTSTLNAVNTKLNTSNLLTTVSVSSNNSMNITRRQNVSSKTLTTPLTTTTVKNTMSTTDKIKEDTSVVKQHVNDQRNPAVATETNKTMSTTNTRVNKTVENAKFSKRNLTNLPNLKTNIVTTTDDPSEDEETFHILTEPEHITAVMGDKAKERTSVDLISVISIAGGVMMAVITVAVVIVMVERCKRPRYEDVRKMNDIRMQVMIDNNDVPPPYVRSIFHTPLPDPPSENKCHYQPISTLDRNIKQFMRPVVVQTISPIMLENFRGILECHYDHLPRRSHDFAPVQTRCSIPPSVGRSDELHQHRVASMTESTIEALKCEAKLDVIDSTTSEPLYAEIPCWRPPSEHAIEIVNMNGEAVTEL